MKPMSYKENNAVEPPEIDDVAYETEAGSISQEPAESITREDINRIIAEIREARAEIGTLNDLFVRRLFDDRQKGQLIQTLQSASEFVVIEPFAHDLILLIDRAQRMHGEFAASVVEELEDILARRGIRRIAVTSQFDPHLERVTRVIEREDDDRATVVGIVRNGYMFGDRVLRPAEVVISKPIAGPASATSVVDDPNQEMDDRS